MKFELTDGLNIISIGLSEIGSYFSYRKPLTTVWYDCRGSVGKYLCLTQSNPSHRNEIHNTILENLATNYTDKEADLLPLLHPLLRTLKNGEYLLTYYHSTQSKYNNTHTDNPYQYSWRVIFSESLIREEQQSKLHEYEIFLSQKKREGLPLCNIIDFTTDNFYDGFYKALIATQPQSAINPERVTYFEQQIAKGERPFAIIVNSFYYEALPNSANSTTECSLSSEDYILDGHHKLLAYKNLHIDPSIVEITHLPKSREEVCFNVEELIEVLYPWQVQHILEHWEEREQYILPLLKNPQSKIHSFIKNGLHKEFYTNGQIKHQAFYVNGIIEGEGIWWYKNGQIAQTQYFRKKIRVGEWKNWYESGKVQFIQRFDDAGRIDGIITSYYENGQVWWEQLYLHGQLLESKDYNRSGEVERIEKVAPHP